MNHRRRQGHKGKGKGPKQHQNKGGEPRRQRVPDYLNGYRVGSSASHTSTTAPGLAFSLFYDDGGDDRGKQQALERIAEKYQTAYRELAEALRKRQKRISQGWPQERLFCIDARNTAPFTTGLGAEHPVENGFAFLNPYGVPYLPGSGVKGVLRRAAENLALRQAADWTPLRVWLFFGFDASASYLPAEAPGKVPKFVQRLGDPFRAAYTAWLAQLSSTELASGETAAEVDLLAQALPPSKRPRTAEERKAFLKRLGEDRELRQWLHWRGALSFWDVFPDGKLTVEIMTPHFKAYYEGSEPPHEAGQPNPIPFLAVAPDARFAFYVTCAWERLPEHLRPVWQALVRAAFAEAFEWLGFGAKTAVGYGVLEPAQPSTGVAETQAREAQGGGRPSQESTHLQEVELEVPDATLRWDAGQRMLVAEWQDDEGVHKKAHAEGDTAQQILEQLPESARERLTTGKQKKRRISGVGVCVRDKHGYFELVAVTDLPDAYR